MTWLTHRRALVSEARNEGGVFGLLVLGLELSLTVFKALLGEALFQCPLDRW
jgi:hypothetical protein